MLRCDDQATLKFAVRSIRATGVAVRKRGRGQSPRQPAGGAGIAPDRHALLADLLPAFPSKKRPPREPRSLLDEALNVCREDKEFAPAPEPASPSLKSPGAAPALVPSAPSERSKFRVVVKAHDLCLRTALPMSVYPVAEPGPPAHMGSYRFGFNLRSPLPVAVTRRGTHKRATFMATRHWDWQTGLIWGHPAPATSSICL